MGKQRRNRTARGKDGVSRRFLAALAGAAAVVFLIAGPVAAVGAAWSGPRPVQSHRHGDGGDQGSSSGQVGDGGGEHGHSNGGNGSGGARARHNNEDQQGSNQSSGAAVGSTAVTTPQLPVVTLPATPVPASPVPAPRPAAATAGRGATVAARTAGAAPTRVAPAAGVVSGALAGGGLPLPPGVAPTPPADLFPIPGAPTGPGGPLQTARSYSLLLALAGVLVVFLGLQGRLGRRDPRLATPPRDDLDFEDFE